MQRINSLAKSKTYVFNQGLVYCILINLQLTERDRGFKPLPDNSVAHEEDRAEETYDGEVSALRAQITEANVYNLFLRHDPYSDFYRMNSKELLKGNSQSLCSTCK
jgi:hypothetical protein